MKKNIHALILCICLVFVSLSCSLPVSKEGDNVLLSDYADANQIQNEYQVENINDEENVQVSHLKEIDKKDAETGDLMLYFSERKDTFSFITDYDICIRLCQDASDSYVNLLRGNEVEDSFLPYIINDNLAKYMYITAHSFPHRAVSSQCRFYLTKFELISNEHAVVEGQIISKNGSTIESLGVSTFVLTKEGRRIIVADWYNAFGPDSMDVEYRIKKYETVYDAEFWIDNERYEPFMQSLSSDAILDKK